MYEKLQRDYTKSPIKPYEQINKEDLYYLYIVCDYTQQEVANILNCNCGKVQRACKKYNFNKPDEHIRKQILEKLRKTIENRTDEQKLLIKEKHKQYWNNLSKEEMDNWKKQVSKNSKNMWKTRSKEDIQKTKQKMSQSMRNYRKNLTTEQTNNRIEKFKKTWYSVTCKQKQERNQKNSQAKKLWWNTVSEEEKKNWIQKAQETRDSWTEEKKKQIQEKIYNTKKLNCSLNSSSWEDDVKNKLVQKFNIKCQYKTDKYPFACDFYIIEKDLFIECNFHWTHGPAPFDEKNQEHINLLQKWQQKNTKYYQNAIHVWTDLDIRKLKIAKENNINRLVFYKKQDFENWLEEQ